jgi:mono/diheme cytochrome c family protein
LNTYRLIIAICSVLFAFTAARAQTPTPNSSLTANVAFEKNCAKCHGKTAKGRLFRGPSLTSKKAAVATTDQLSGIITNGKGHMPKFGGKLTAEDISTLVSQINALNGK